jgi:hypothetical protein
MFRPFAIFRTFDIFRSGSGAGGGGSTTPTETYYVLAGGNRILAGTDLITVGAP